MRASFSSATNANPLFAELARKGLKFRVTGASTVGCGGSPSSGTDLRYLTVRFAANTGRPLYQQALPIVSTCFAGVPEFVTDGENGLLLTPDADHLFDRGFVSFDDNGDVLWSPVVHVPSLLRMGLDPASIKNVGRFSEGQRSYLAFHRDSVFLQSSFKY